jgi:hypothetical protein
MARKKKNMYDDAGDFDVHAFIQSNGEVTNVNEPERSEDSTESSDDLILSEVVAWFNISAVNDPRALWTYVSGAKFLAEFPLWGPYLRSELRKAMNNLPRNFTIESCQRHISATRDFLSGYSAKHFARENEAIMGELRRLHSKFKITEYFWIRKQRLDGIKFLNQSDATSINGGCWHSLK